MIKSRGGGIDKESVRCKIKGKQEVTVTPRLLASVID